MDITPLEIDTMENHQQSERAKADFSLVLASSVHDMKNSLGMLLNSLEVMVRDAPPQDEHQAKNFAILQYEASRINTELVQLLSIYRMENDNMPLHIDEHFVIDLLEEQVARNHMLLESRGLTLQVDCDEDLNGYFDAELIGGVINNIIVNGARYSKKQMRIAAEYENDELVISVEDDGGGYPPAMLGTPEQSFRKSVSFSEGSTNLGLYFALEVARLHQRDDKQGRIELSNGGVLGGGVFKIFIP